MGVLPQTAVNASCHVDERAELYEQKGMLPSFGARALTAISRNGVCACHLIAVERLGWRMADLENYNPVTSRSQPFALAVSIVAIVESATGRHIAVLHLLLLPAQPLFPRPFPVVTLE